MEYSDGILRIYCMSREQGGARQRQRVSLVEEMANIGNSKTLEVSAREGLTIQELSVKITEQVFGIPSGAFSGIMTYRDEGGQLRVWDHRSPVEITNENGEPKIIEASIGAVMAEMFSNQRYVVKYINDVGPITTKDPREKCEGQIDAVIAQTKKDLEKYRQIIDVHLNEARRRINVPQEVRRKLQDTLSVYDILIKELELKKRGYELSRAYPADPRKHNLQLEIKYLSGGNILILRGYIHDKDWQRNFGGNVGKASGLAQIYSSVRHIVVEGFVNNELGQSLSERWKLNDGDYDTLMRELARSGFLGDFMEIDSRFVGRMKEKYFDSLPSIEQNFTKLFNFMCASDPEMFGQIDIEKFREYFEVQKLFGPSSITSREQPLGLDTFEGGTYHNNFPSVDKNLDTRTYPTGFEMGQMAFVDALSVIKLLLLNGEMEAGRVDGGIVVDIQGAKHISLKSFFLDNPAYAMRVVLRNVHEILTSHPDVTSIDDVLNKLSHMDEDTWRWVFDFIGEIPVARVDKPELLRRRVDRRPRFLQRKIHKQPSINPVKQMNNTQKKALDEVIHSLLRRTSPAQQTLL